KLATRNLGILVIHFVFHLKNCRMTAPTAAFVTTPFHLWRRTDVFYEIARPKPVSSTKPVLLYNRFALGDKKKLLSRKKWVANPIPQLSIPARQQHLEEI